jgi:hypothetical protein
MADVYNFDNFQIPATGVAGGYTGGAQQGREFDMKMSSFGALVGGSRLVTATVSCVATSWDYTRSGFGFADKGNFENPTIPSFSQDGEYDENPYVWGSTVKKTRDDEFAVMGIGNRRSNSATNQPGFDVSDTFAAIDDGTNAPKKFPAEGWRTFGGRTGGPADYQV